MRTCSNGPTGAVEGPVNFQLRNRDFTHSLEKGIAWAMPKVMCLHSSRDSQQGCYADVLLAWDGMAKTCGDDGTVMMVEDWRNIAPWNYAGLYWVESRDHPRRGQDMSWKGGVGQQVSVKGWFMFMFMVDVF